MSTIIFSDQERQIEALVWYNDQVRHFVYKDKIIMLQVCIMSQN